MVQLDTWEQKVNGSYYNSPLNNMGLNLEKREKNSRISEPAQFQPAFKGQLYSTLTQILPSGNIHSGYLKISYYKYICWTPEKNYIDQRSKKLLIQIGSERVKLILFCAYWSFPFPQLLVSVTRYTHTYIFTHIHTNILMHILKTQIPYPPSKKNLNFETTVRQDLKSGFYHNQLLGPTF